MALDGDIVRRAQRALGRPKMVGKYRTFLNGGKMVQLN